MKCTMCCGVQAHRGQARAVFVRHDIETAYGDKSNLSREHNVRAVPCFLFFDGGAVVSTRDGERLGVGCAVRWVEDVRCSLGRSGGGGLASYSRRDYEARVWYFCPSTRLGAASWLTVSHRVQMQLAGQQLVAVCRCVHLGP